MQSGRNRQTFQQDDSSLQEITETLDLHLAVKSRYFVVIRVERGARGDSRRLSPKLLSRIGASGGQLVVLQQMQGAQIGPSSHVSLQGQQDPGHRLQAVQQDEKIEHTHPLPHLKFQHGPIPPM